MENNIYDAIESWAGVSTWHSGSQYDERRFFLVMKDLSREPGYEVDSYAFYSALTKHANNHNKINGDNCDYWMDLLSKFTLRAEIISRYELEIKDM
ncbi:hypothetical protein [Photobacterium profundum]|uniref:hypothetical protein n=1 Tax=Photobacterium profundum TaxID=74109 RepID=UPI000057B72B|nr:hypothetical protein [Photobacterium profundum]